MVREESRILETLRLIANIRGLPDALKLGDAVTLQSIALPVAVNYQEDAVELLDTQGISRISIYKKTGANVVDYAITQGSTSLMGTDFVRKSLNQQADARGNKYSGYVLLDKGRFFFVISPVYDKSGDLVGCVAVGRSLENLVDNIRQDTLGHVTLYALDGTILTSTLRFQGVDHPVDPAQANLLLLNQDVQSPVREIKIASTTYSEILGPWEVRGGQDLGVIGTSLAQNFFRDRLC